MTAAADNDLVAAPSLRVGDSLSRSRGAIPNIYVSVPNHWTNLSPTLEVIVSICHQYGVTEVEVTAPIASVNSDAYAQCGSGESGTAYFVNWNPAYDTGMELGANTFTVYACSNWPAYACDERTFTYYREYPEDTETTLTPLDPGTVLAIGQNATLRYRIANGVGYARTYSLAALCTRSASGCSIVGSSHVTIAGGNSATVSVLVSGNSVGMGVVTFRVCRYVDSQDVCSQRTNTHPVPPSAPVARAVTVTPTANTTQQGNGTTFSASFTVGNTGTVATTYTLQASCTVALEATPCKAPATVTIGAGSSSMVTVDSIVAKSFSTPTVGAVYLTARAEGASATGRTAVTVGPNGGSGGAPSVLVASHAVNPGSTLARGQCVSFAAGDAAGVECGDLRLAHPLPTVHTMGRRWTPALTYLSRHANPIALVAADVTTLHATPDTMGISLEITGGASLPMRKFAWPASCRNAACRVVYPVNADSLALATGLYHYTLRAQSPGDSSYAATDTGSFVVVNRIASPFGRGWWLEGLEQVLHLSATHKLWIGGDGSTRLYIRGAGADTANYYAHAPLTRVDTLGHVGSGDWRRLLPDRAYVRFDDNGRHTRTVGRLGDTTVFTYTSDRLTRILLPAPAASSAYLRYELAYSGGLLTQVRAERNPGDSTRTVAVTHAGNGAVDGITDPNAHVVRFDTAGAHGRVGWRRRRIAADTVAFTYDAFGAISQTSIGMQRTGDTTITTRYCPAETRSLVACAWSEGSVGGVPLPSVVTRVDGPRGGLIDVTTFHLNRFGQLDSLFDALGGRTALGRDPDFPGRVLGVQDPTGLTQQAAYNARGLPTSLTTVNPIGTDSNAVTTIAWHTKWHLPLTVAQPLLDSIIHSYDSTWPLRNWTQRSNDSGSRVNFHYDDDNLVDSVVGPGQHTTLWRDALGNVSAVREFAAKITSVRDPFGFEIKREDDAGRFTERIVRNPIGLVDSVITVGLATTRLDSLGDATWDLVPERTRIVHNTYDAEGNVLTIGRWTLGGPGTAGAQTSYLYDAANRVLRHNEAVHPDSFRYDPAGNATIQITRRGHQVRQGYDALGRLLYRFLPEVSAAQVVCEACSNQPPGWIGPRVTFPYFGSPLLGGGTTPSLLIPGDLELFTYDAGGRLLTADNRDARIARSYYANGALKTDTLRLRRYDAADTAASPYATHVYGLTFLVDLLGRRTGRSDTFGRHLKYTYHPETGFLTGLVDSLIGSGSKTTFAMTHNTIGQLLTRQVVGASPGIALTNTYDTAGRLESRSETGFGGYTIFADAFTYDERDKQVSRHSAAWNATLSDTAYVAYDGFGAVSAVTRYVNYGTLGRLTDEFDADALGRVWRTHSNRASPAGRAASDQLYSGDVQTARQPDPLSTVRSGSAPAVTVLDTVTHSFDNARNLVLALQLARRFSHLDGQGEDVFESPLEGSEYAFYAYDALQRLRVSQRSFDRSTGRHLQTEYRYDALGRRVLVRTRADVQTCPDSVSALSGNCLSTMDRFVWDGDELLYELRSAGHAGAGDATLESTTAPSGAAFFGRVRYVHAEGIDDPVLVHKDGSAAFVPHRSGRGTYETGTYVGSGTEVTGYHWPQRYAGVYHAPDARVSPPTATSWQGSLLDGKTDPSGLQYMRNRYYNPASGQFTQPDPIGLAGGLNLYGYANGDPINFSDPFGLCPDSLATAEREECEKAEEAEREQRAAERTAYLSRMHTCTQDTPGFNAMLALSPLGLANMKMGQGFRQPGSSPFTSVDRRFPGLPGANTQGGMPVRTVGSGAVKTAGTLGTGAAVVSTFATTYVVTTLVRCGLEAREP
ncbi:MAG: RHS repeat-associated core domain-containing protein [Gemmatimonadaceae bacterium]|nr:RHS repeat-associated core domain-containing protein [Gemmatimonadaceae bacterium]MCW5827204.1 RHS repeat-associated core domain-containing protein [Gemmatimonadaceae bacterium]